MPRVDDAFLLKVLQACAEHAPAPLYPARFAKEQSLDRDQLDAALDELRRRGLIRLTDWVKDAGQGRALTEAGKEAVQSENLAPVRLPAEAGSADKSVSLYERGELVRGAIYEPKPAYVAWALVAINVAFFLFGAVYTIWRQLPVHEYLLGVDGVHNTTSAVLYNIGYLHKDLILPDWPEMRPQFERLFLFFFLHIGILHLGLNMFFLVSTGELIEGMWGRWRFLLLYLISGFVSGCVVLLFNIWQGRAVPTAGASGAVCGLFASMLAWFYFNRAHVPGELLQEWKRILTINVAVLVGMSLIPGVSWQGHLGGAIGGALTAVLLNVQRFHPVGAIRVFAFAGVLLIPIAFFGAVLWQAGWFHPIPV
jgi:membrane associated rhomboid family serine protease